MWACVFQRIPHNSEQVKVFAAADVVVTAHTGGLLNIGYMRPWSAVVRLCDVCCVHKAVVCIVCMACMTCMACIACIACMAWLGCGGTAAV